MLQSVNMIDNVAGAGAVVLPSRGARVRSHERPPLLGIALPVTAARMMAPAAVRAVRLRGRVAMAAEVRPVRRVPRANTARVRTVRRVRRAVMMAAGQRRRGDREGECQDSGEQAYGLHSVPPAYQHGWR